MASTFTNLLYHIIFSTKNRKNFIDYSFQDELYYYIGGIIRGEKGKTIVIGGTSDHVHILAKFSQSVMMSNILQHVKGSSSKWINEKNFITPRFYWQRGYAAFTVSESMVGVITNYIENQEEHHKKMTFREELTILLKKHNIEYNEKYLWD